MLKMKCLAKCKCIRETIKQAWSLKTIQISPPLGPVKLWHNNTTQERTNAWFTPLKHYYNQRYDVHICKSTYSVKLGVSLSDDNFFLCHLRELVRICTLLIHKNSHSQKFNLNYLNCPKVKDSTILLHSQFLILCTGLHIFIYVTAFSSTSVMDWLDCFPISKRT